LLDWNIILTNVPREKLSVNEALVLYRCRWQMELLWKLSKEIDHVDTWRSEKPERILTEILEKLVGLADQSLGHARRVLAGPAP
jgi:IS4 transposase